MIEFVIQVIRNNAILGVLILLGTLPLERHEPIVHLIRSIAIFNVTTGITFLVLYKIVKHFWPDEI